MNIFELLKQVPVSEVLRERLEFEQSKADFEKDQLNAKLEASELRARNTESQRDELKASLETEQKNHALTRNELDQTRAIIQKFTKGPQPPPRLSVVMPYRSRNF